MTDYIRRLVSGNKARFRDDNLDLELDLVYVTDQVIIMGYPASGIEGLYRNRREDAIRFLEYRHGKNYWVFNFCPIKENSYEADIFEGRVSRYPFPDHHAPPLAIMPLVAREMYAWLSTSPDHVAVLHCKAGKGRSGTMACSYILSLDDSPSPPQLERSHNAKTWASQRMQTAVEALPKEEENISATIKPLGSIPEQKTVSDTDGILEIDKGGSPPLPSSPNPEKSFTDALKGVLDLHTAQRMKPALEEKKSKQGVSIPSQRRFLYYWALLLAHEAPKHMWTKEPNPKIRLKKVQLRMREQSQIRMSIVKAANKLIEKTSLAKGPIVGQDSDKGSSSQVWVSLARYDDRLVDLLEEWEKYTRDPEGHMGRRRPGSETLSRGESTESEVLNEIFKSGKWDKGKMVRSFARLGDITNSQKKLVDDKGDKINIYTLRPLSDKRWEGLKHDLHQGLANGNQEVLQEIEGNADATGMSRSEANSINDVTTSALSPKADSQTLPGTNIEEGILLDAGREVRIKLYVGQVFIGWFWFIPTFHMPQPPPAGSPSEPTKTILTLTRKDIDFPLGLGSAIIDVEIEMEWVSPSIITPSQPIQTPLEPPVRARTDNSHIGTESEPAPTGAISTVLQKIAGGGAEFGTENAGLREAVEAKQGATE